MGKTILERMCGISMKMRSLIRDGLELTPENYRKAGADFKALEKTLGLNRMQVLFLTAVVEKSSRYRMDGDDVSSYLGMEYLEFLTHDDELDALRKKGYIRMDKDGNIVLPPEVLRTLKENRPVEPEKTSGLDTARILTRIRRKLSVRADDQMTTGEVRSEIDYLLQENPETSISRVCRKRLSGVCGDERLVFYALIYRYYYEEDDMVGWHDLDDYFDDEELDDLKGDCAAGYLDLQQKGLIEYAGQDGMLTKDFFRIKDDIKEELLADVGGLRKKQAKVSASRKISASSIAPKVLFYNPSEERQVAMLRELMSEERFAGIRATMKKKNYRTGFTCLFHGAPGTGKTETVYQIARESGRDLFCVDVSQIKSCWVGESEKNIKEVFKKYRECVQTASKVPILLFNEADAVFGIRREGAGSAVDKMENSIQNIILQEMEDLDGILIATTNLTSNLDRAFERRFLYKVCFEKPSLEARVSIWRSMMPSLSEKEAEELAADFGFSGGQIENIVRKREIKALIGPEEPGFDEVRAYCEEETLDNTPARRRIGF